MTDEEIKICLERMSNGKTSDVMNFDYAGTLAYIKRIESENAELRARLDKAVELPFIHKVFVKDLRGNIQEDYQVVYLDDEDNFIYISTHTTKDSAEDFIAELKGEEEQCQHTGV